MSTFSLVIEPWAAVQRAGKPCLESLRSVMVDAHEIADLDWGDPLVGAATLSLLCAIYRDAFRVETLGDFISLWDQKRFAAELLDAYFKRYEDRFDLFSDTAPFLQTPGLTAMSGGPKPVSLLQLEAATGNNVPLFASRTESDAEPLVPAEAARRLLAVQMFDTAAIKTGADRDPQAKAGKTSGNPTGPLGQMGYVAVIGQNLFETILLNAPIGPFAKKDQTAWDRKPPTAQWSARQPDGDLDLATWPTRRVRLFPDEIDGDVLVTGALVCGGDRLIGAQDIEWRTGWRRVDKPKPGEPSRRPRRHQAGRAAWRGLSGLLGGGDGDREVKPGVLRQLSELVPDGIPTSHPLALQTVGVEYGNMSAVIEDVIADRVPLPVAALNDGPDGANVRMAIEEMALQADAVAAALNNLGANIRRATGGEDIPWDKGQRLGDTFVHGLRIDAHRFLAGLASSPDRHAEARLVWERLLRQRSNAVAQAALDQVPPKAWLGHGESGKEIGLATIERFFRASINKTLTLTVAPARAMKSTDSATTDRMVKESAS